MSPGTTWTLQMVWSILNDFDSSKAAKASAEELDSMFPYFELTGICTKPLQAILPNSFELCNNVTARPRLFKTHLMYEMLPDQVSEKKPKIIYVTRNPRDACVSLYHYITALQVYSGTFEDYFDAFMNDTMPYYTPMIQGIHSFWDKREMDHVLFITFEDMKEDLASVVKQVAKFLGKEPMTDQVTKLCDELSFSNMKESDGGAVGHQENLTKVIADADQVDHGEERPREGFLRKGQVGGWASIFNDEQTQRFAEWEARWLKDSDLMFRNNI